MVPNEHVYLDTCIPAHTCTPAHTYLHMYTHTHLDAHALLHIHAHLHSHAHTCIPAHLHTSEHLLTKPKQQKRRTAQLPPNKTFLQFVPFYIIWSRVLDLDVWNYAESILYGLVSYNIFNWKNILHIEYVFISVS